ncbi:T9SS type B sorting domain-containing protein [Lacinutrix sp. MEBiC02404]
MALKNRVCILLILLFISLDSNAQLSFCSGNSGDPIFTENFGTAPSATLQNVSLPSGTTTYNFLGATVFGDGKYTVSNSSDYWNWFDGPNYGFEDHTPGDTNGRMLIVNASHTPGEFFSLPVSGLCENTTYEFSSWLVNLTPRDLYNIGSLPNPCNVSFEIWDSLDTTQLASGTTGDFFGGLSTDTGEWVPYGLVFQTLVGQTSVILKMVNNGVGGYGNDLAIDDIVFKTCGDFISIGDSANNPNISISSCETPYATTLTVTPDFSVFTSHFYQWQESMDGITWTDISGETSASSTINGITATTYYRSKVAESMVNLNNSSCNTVSDVFSITVNPVPANPGNVNCWDNFQLDATSCLYVNLGTVPTNPGNVTCWDDFQLDATSCTYVNLGTAPTNPGNVNCWDDFQLDATSCLYVNLGTAPSNPGNVTCWDDFQLDATSCMYVNLGTAPANPGNVTCWDDFQLDATSCMYVNLGTAPTNPGNMTCWDDFQLDTTSCMYVNLGTAPINPGNVTCWDDFQLDATSCMYVNLGTAPTNSGNVTCWDDFQYDVASCMYVNLGTAPTNPGNVTCWDDFQLDATSCTYVNLGTAPINPGNVTCWDDFQLDTTSCMYVNLGTAPTNPGNVNCWDDFQFDATSCMYVNLGTAPINPGNVTCWDDYQLDPTSCLYVNLGTAPTNPGNVTCWDDYQFDATSCLYVNLGTAPTNPGNVTCWDDYQLDPTSCLYVNLGTAPNHPGNVTCWDDFQLDTTSCLYVNLGTAPTNPGNITCWDDFQLDTTSCTYVNLGTAPTNPGNVTCWDDFQLDTTSCMYVNLGTAPTNPGNVTCWDDFQLDATSCMYVNQGTQPLDTVEEFVMFCEGETIILYANTTIVTPNYLWDSGETTDSITVSSAGDYSVEVSDSCSTTIINFYVSQIDIPVIEAVTSNGSDIVVEMTSTGDFLYSLDGISFQTNPTFYNVVAGQYILYVKSSDCDTTVSIAHLHFYIPKVFTPNNDSYNDTFSLAISNYFASTEVYIFDRYGKLLYSAINSNVNWDGTFKNKKLPSSDYWYHIIIGEQQFKGHITLKR